MSDDDDQMILWKLGAARERTHADRRRRAFPSDVTPLRGVVFGGGCHDLEVEVDVVPDDGPT
jgi:hypothetical protein